MNKPKTQNWLIRSWRQFLRTALVSDIRFLLSCMFPAKARSEAMGRKVSATGLLALALWVFLGLNVIVSALGYRAIIFENLMLDVGLSGGVLSALLAAMIISGFVGVVAINLAQFVRGMFPDYASLIIMSVVSLMVIPADQDRMRVGTLAAQQMISEKTLDVPSHISAVDAQAILDKEVELYGIFGKMSWCNQHHCRAHLVDEEQPKRRQSMICAKGGKACKQIVKVPHDYQGSRDNLNRYRAKIDGIEAEIALLKANANSALMAEVGRVKTFNSHVQKQESSIGEAGMMIQRYIYHATFLVCFFLALIALPYFREEQEEVLEKSQAGAYLEHGRLRITQRMWWQHSLQSLGFGGKSRWSPGKGFRWGKEDWTSVFASQNESQPIGFKQAQSEDTASSQLAEIERRLSEIENRQPLSTDDAAPDYRAANDTSVPRSGPPKRKGKGGANQHSFSSTYQPMLQAREAVKARNRQRIIQTRQQLLQTPNEKASAANIARLTGLSPRTVRTHLKEIDSDPHAVGSLIQ
ncbi:MAG: hypothetical protein AAFQ68_15505 [Bacteroidota bacterium]